MERICMVGYKHNDQPVSPFHDLSSITDLYSEGIDCRSSVLPVKGRGIDQDPSFLCINTMRLSTMHGTSLQNCFYSSDNKRRCMFGKVMSDDNNTAMWFRDTDVGYAINSGDLQVLLILMQTVCALAIPEMGN